MGRKNPRFTLRFEGEEFEMETLSNDDMMVRRHWHKGQFYELDVLRNIRRQARPGVFFDGGANVGNHTIFFSHFCEQCTKVIAVEAVPALFQVLVRNINANDCERPKMVPVNWAIHSTSSMVAEYTALDMSNLGSTRMKIRERNYNDAQPGAMGNKILTQRIDDIVKAHDNVTLIKLDIEGGEADAIPGAFETISRCRPMIVMEARKKHELETHTELMGMLNYRRAKSSGKTGTYIWQPKEFA